MLNKEELLHDLQVISEDIKKDDIPADYIVDQLIDWINDGAYDVKINQI